ncbi:MAG: AlpA family phage regulatory protein [Pseudomonadales bacterium]|nr:AlpA family phage regulatory protein [Pseudomonadales bacterium]
MNITFLRLPAVLAATGYKRSTLYLRMSQGLWPRPVSLGYRCVGWPQHEVEAINSARIADCSEAGIRELVESLYAARRSVAFPGALQ